MKTKAEQEALFQEGVANCDFSSQRRMSNHRPIYENIRSHDGRWFVRTHADLNQNTLELYDKKEKIKFLIFHENYQIKLRDLNFDASSNHLSFVGTPWGQGGLGEIYAIDLRTFEQFRFGEKRSSYRYPVVVSDAGDILFYQTSGGPKIKKMSMLHLAGRDRIFYWLGYRDPAGQVAFMKTYKGKDTEFVEFLNEFENDRSYYRNFEEFSGPPGMMINEAEKKYYAFGIFYREANNGRVGLPSLEHVTKTEIRIQDFTAIAGAREKVRVTDVIRALRPMGTNPTLPEEMATYDVREFCIANTNFG